jgi:beta-galactosidase/beta-glucuronidase
MDGTTIISSVLKEVTITQAGKTDVTLTLSSLGNVKLLDVDALHLYDIVTTLSIDGEPVHDYRTRIGFRDAKPSKDFTKTFHAALGGSNSRFS